MASAASLTIKKYDNTTDIIFDSVVGAGGDGQPAVWRQDTGNSLPLQLRPTLELRTKWNGPRTARQAIARAVFPYAYQDTTTSLYAVKDKIVGELIITVPQSIPASNVNEAVSQMMKLFSGSTSQPLSSAQQLLAVTTGWAPT